MVHVDGYAIVFKVYELVGNTQQDFEFGWTKC